MSHRLRNGSCFLHGPADDEPAPRRGRNPGRVCQRQRHPASGATLVELLISLSLLTIGVLAIVGTSHAVRRQAEIGARRSAEALAAQQVLERKGMGTPGDSAWIDTLTIGVHEVTVRVERQDSIAGLVRLRVRADAGAGEDAWDLETARWLP